MNEDNRRTVWRAAREIERGVTFGADGVFGDHGKELGAMIAQDFPAGTLSKESSLLLFRRIPLASGLTRAPLVDFDRSGFCCTQLLATHLCINSRDLVEAPSTHYNAFPNHRLLRDGNFLRAHW